MASSFEEWTTLWETIGYKMFTSNRKQTVEKRKFVSRSALPRPRHKHSSQLDCVDFRFINYYSKKHMASYPNTLDSAVGVCRDLRVW